ncbi:Cerebellar degeneration-related protein 2 [Frankliniella fusca]|uniref:Cerebellar degeneration-related protein 2 n=1 Tax=Frankliniella fusca TaxID=407009 RepID=A0AAE1LIC1_9NEOP|nr:Cerebellar degeneration-related protein 2 [Frankliniella fusca]
MDKDEPHVKRLRLPAMPPSTSDDDEGEMSPFAVSLDGRLQHGVSLEERLSRQRFTQSGGLAPAELQLRPSSFSSLGSTRIQLPAVQSRPGIVSCSPALSSSNVIEDKGSCSAAVRGMQEHIPIDTDSGPTGASQKFLTLPAEHIFSQADHVSPITYLAPNMPLVPINEGVPLVWEHFISHEPQQVIPSEDFQIFEDMYSNLEEITEGTESCYDAPENNPPEISVHTTSKDVSHLELFSNSCLSVQDSVVSILSFASSCRLSGTDFCKLLDLLHLLLPKPNNLPSSKHSAFSIFKNDNKPMNLIYYCSKCWKVRNSAHDKCDVCQKSTIKYFLVCSIVDQIKKMFTRPGFVEKLQYKYTRTKEHQDNIEDVYDSSIYKEAENSFLTDVFKISLTWYTDGVALFNCSSYSLWPFMFIINELPPEERFKEENLIIGGFWGDSCKPHPNLFLLPMYKEIKILKEGFPVSVYGEEHEVEVKGVVLFGTADVPAKASFMNMKGHSGYCSCPKCFIRGEKSAATGNVTVFPHVENLVLRNDTNYAECVKNAALRKSEDRGVFGPSLLSYISYSSFIQSISIDSMHCLGGLVKQLLRLWFDGKYSSEPFSLSTSTDKVNALLKELNLPHFVQRLPEDVTQLHFWKASLCRNFLLYIAIVVMKPFMKPDYCSNLCLLANGAALLHKSSITFSDITMADELLNQFSKTFEELYGVRHMSTNIHLLRHLASSVAECGNLCLTNCFKFEDLNGKLATLVHGTNHAALQIIKNLSVLSDLPLLVSGLQCEEAKSYCAKLKNPKYVSLTEKIDKHVHVVGEFDCITQHSASISELCISIFGKPVPFQTFSRIFKKKVLFVSSSYEKGSRVSSFCKYYASEGPVHGKILTFVKVLVEPPQYFAYVMQSDNEPLAFERHVVFSSLSEKTDFIPLRNLISVSWYLLVHDIPYLVDPLNPYEME